MKVVILGQDPYHEPGQAHGLCFSVQDGVPFPFPLINIFKEIQDDLGHRFPTTKQLDSLGRSRRITAKRHAHSTSASSRSSHQNRGWETFTDAIHRLAAERSHIVYILWGSYAQKKGAFIDSSRNLVLNQPIRPHFFRLPGILRKQAFQQSQ